MRFHADLHVHSKYSRATSRDLDLEHLAAWACRKGIGVVGTGDFTHPAWQAGLKSKLVPAEPGLFRLRDDIADAVARTLPAGCRMPVRFMLEVEISTIYKKADRTRKVHHLIYAPDLPTAERISARLARIGNIASDGRPILGLDSRNLLEITLESHPQAYLVPAHIWTPWFAALGSQSGFDSIADCYGDLAEHIFAVETGLSSDPPMNWRVSFLDRYRLTSNSDAHSPGKLGREATAFDCDLDYFAIKHALETGHGYAGTVEFFPEEGKYHLDGHRNCRTRLTPKETLAHGGRCPVCGNPVTVGVEHRIEKLADRQEPVRPATAGEVTNLVPLPEILSELTASGPATQTVARGYDQAIARLGPELGILQTVPVEDIAHAGSPMLADAVARLRAGDVIREAGYDGEYGIIRLFKEGELARLTRGALLFETPTASRPSSSRPRRMPEAAPAPRPAPEPATRPALELVHDRAISPGILAALDDQQRVAAAAVDGAVLIIAGPGSGKTRTLTHRIAHLIAERGAAPESCLAITFTRRAAAEMRERLARLLPESAGAIPIHTFHSLGLAILRAHPEAAGLHRGFRIATEAERISLLATALGIDTAKAERMLRAISKAKRGPTKRGPTEPSGDLAEAIAAYDSALALANCVDFDDLMTRSVRALTDRPALAADYRERFRFVSVDEFQDVDEQQYRLLALIAPQGSNLCIIGDPNQAIYGFRGVDAACFERFHRDYPAARSIALRRNYRSTGTIVSASSQVVTVGEDPPIAEIVRDLNEHITVQTAPTDRAEAEAVVKAIEEAIGGHTFFSIDSGRAADAGARSLSFGDIAVLYRTEAQTAVLREALDRSGIPYQKASHSTLAEEPAAQALLQELSAAAVETPLDDALRQAAVRCAERGTAAASLQQAQQRLTAIATACNGDRDRFLDAVALAAESDLLDPSADRVSLLTLHGAKGLEFPVVIITGLEDGIVPLSFGELDDDAIAEERRLLYVGMTRAMDRLILSHARQRLWRGRVREQTPSPFLRDIEEALLQRRRATPGRNKAQDRQLSLF
ncbi:MAG: UvrD-helicase domain-containing protein [Hyphomicrobiales bacterium]|nr:UvrD-helicase domain-containing protein [Hyphomicrobiales bacterium]